MYALHRDVADCNCSGKTGPRVASMLAVSLKVREGVEFQLSCFSHRWLAPTSNILLQRQPARYHVSSLDIEGRLYGCASACHTLTKDKVSRYNSTGDANFALCFMAPSLTGPFQAQRLPLI